jgi:hypothetical protein
LTSGSNLPGGKVSEGHICAHLRFYERKECL